ncbi:MAG TPA: HAD hydrolase-like protein [Rhodospirillales bacterium]|nr:HAD hydrolase-like protein [Rhodospirillales bacterium]
MPKQYYFQWQTLFDGGDLDERHVMTASRYNAVFFDFDGVLVESPAIKAAAFRSLYAEYGAQVENEAAAYHKANAGISRLIKIRHCHQALLGITLGDAELAALGERYTAIVVEKVIACDWVPGAAGFLDAARGALALFVVSGTPEEELQRIAARRGMTHTFVEVRGSPPGKEAIVRELLERHRLVPRRTLFIGDSLVDWQAAEACGLDFLGRVAPGHASPFPKGTRVVSDLKALDTVVALR